MDDRTIFPEDINIIIDSYVDLKQAIVELPKSEMHSLIANCLFSLEMELKEYRGDMLVDICYRLRGHHNRPAGRMLKYLHEAKTAIRYFKQKLYYISKDYITDVDNEYLLR